MDYELEKLLEEIEFWESLMGDCEERLNDPDCVRLNELLALAQYRFAKACGYYANQTLAH